MAIDWASGGGETADPRVQAAAGGFGGVTGVGQGRRPAGETPGASFWQGANALTAAMQGQPVTPVGAYQAAAGVPGTPSSQYGLWHTLAGTGVAPSADPSQLAGSTPTAPAPGVAPGTAGGYGTPTWAASLPAVPGVAPQGMPPAQAAPAATGQPLTAAESYAASRGAPVTQAAPVKAAAPLATTGDALERSAAQAFAPATTQPVATPGGVAPPVPTPEQMPSNPNNPAYGPDGILGLDDLNHPGLTNTDRYFLAGLAWAMNPNDQAARLNFETWKAAMGATPTAPPPTPADAPRGPQYGPNQQLGLEDLGLTTLTNQDRHYLAWLAYAQNPGDPAAKANFDTWEAAMTAAPAATTPAPTTQPAATTGPSRATLAGMAQDYLYQGGSLINQPYTGPMFTPTTGPYSATFSWTDPRDDPRHPVDPALRTGQVGPVQSLSAYHTFNPNTQRALQNSIAAGRGGFLLPEDFVHDVDVTDPVAQARWRNSTFGYSYGDPGAAGGALLPGQDASQDAA